jgi:hypothetical protein
MIIGMAEAWRDTQMAINMKENLKITSRTEKAFILGSMAKSMRESGREGSRKVKAFGKEYSETAISVSGPKAKPTGMVCTNGRMAIGTKGSGSSVLSMAKAVICLQMAMCTLASTVMANPMGLDSTNGKTPRSMLENLKME